MKITFVLPAIGKKEGEKYIKSWKMEPLTVAALKALTPREVETEFYDDRLELIDYTSKTDAVLITVETYTAARAYRIAEEFRKNGTRVIMGGYHATLVPGEVQEHADSIVTGNAEDIWPEVIRDLTLGTLQKVYTGGVGTSCSIPDRSIYKNKRYSPLTLIETGRGCPFACEFCAISSYYKSCYFPRDIRHIVSEIETADNRFVFFVDDNIVANPGFAGKLFDEIMPFKVKWTSQGALTVAKDRTLLKKMKASGCEALLIGFESIDEENLRQMNKDWRYHLGEVDELVNSIHDEGISIYATFVFGFDHDTPESFDRALEFSHKHGFYFAAFNHLLPFPGTALYRRLKEENRLLKEKWWLEPDYRYGDVAFIPKHMEPEELSERCAAARREFYKTSSIFKRGVKLLGRNTDPLVSLIYWSQNFNQKKEVDEKLNIPVGRGLDGLPK